MRVPFAEIDGLIETIASGLSPYKVSIGHRKGRQHRITVHDFYQPKVGNVKVEVLFTFTPSGQSSGVIEISSIWACYRIDESDERRQHYIAMVSTFSTSFRRVLSSLVVD